MDQLVIAGKAYNSRLLVGTGKYADFAQTRAAIDASGAEIVTVAIRRTNIGQDPNQPNLLDALPPEALQAQARALLTGAFCREVINGIADRNTHAVCEAALERALARVGA